MSNNCVDTIHYSSEAQAFPKHFHTGMEFIYVMEGEIELTVKGNSWRAGRDTLVLLNHLEEHEIRVLKEPYTRYFLILNSYHTRRMLTDPSLLLMLRNGPSRLCKLSREQAEEVRWIFKRLLEEKERGDAFSDRQTGDLVTSLFILIYRLETAQEHAELPPGAAAVTQVQDYIDGHFSENLKIAGLAEIFFMSKFYLSHLFRETTGYTVKEYLTLTRLTHARLLLTATDLKINEVCFESGFNDVNSFIRSFKSAYGCTPLVYRKQSKRKGEK